MTTASRSRGLDEIQYRFAAADKHRGLIGESGYRGRVADITLAHMLTRPDRLAFIGHSIRKAGILATGAALTRKGPLETRKKDYDDFARGHHLVGARMLRRRRQFNTEPFLRLRG